MKNIAVITGASSGIGRKFAETIKQGGSFDEVWIIARRLERLEELAKEMPFPTKAIALDLSDKKSYTEYAALLEEEKPNVTLLINCSGFGKFSGVMDTAVDVNLNMVDLNCEAVVALCQHTIPYMKKGAKIINIASVAAFQPIPYINVYGATKSFVLHFSRALNRELKKDGITVTAVCPFWTKTAFFDRAETEKKVVKKYIALYEPRQIVQKAWKDAKRKKRDVSIYGGKAKFQALLVKILPHRLVMRVWLKQQKLP